MSQMKEWNGTNRPVLLVNSRLLRTTSILSRPQLTSGSPSPQLARGSSTIQSSELQVQSTSCPVVTATIKSQIGISVRRNVFIVRFSLIIRYEFCFFHCHAHCSVAVPTMKMLFYLSPSSIFEAKFIRSQSMLCDSRSDSSVNKDT